MADPPKPWRRRELETGKLSSLTLSGTIRLRRFAAAARQAPQYMRAMAAPKRR